MVLVCSKEMLRPLVRNSNLKKHYFKLMISEYAWILPRNRKLRIPIFWAKVVPEPTELSSVSTGNCYSQWPVSLVRYQQSYPESSLSAGELQGFCLDG